MKQTQASHSKPLTSLKGFIDRVEKIESNNNVELLFRGHSNRLKYKIEPSVFRSVEAKEAEDKLFREIIATNPADFSSDTSTLERLARMQHHSCPTRLLDVTYNPLVALYFAVKSSPEVHGEVVVIKTQKRQVKFFDSDTASCLANLARLSYQEKKRVIEDSDYAEPIFGPANPKTKLLHYIKDEKPYFEPRFYARDLQKVILVRAKLNSKRIIAQSGAFLLFGQAESIDESPVDGIEIERISIDAHSKSKIIGSLNSLNINDGSMFLDIDSHAKHLKSKYSIK